MKELSMIEKFVVTILFVIVVPLTTVITSIILLFNSGFFEFIMTFLVGVAIEFFIFFVMTIRIIILDNFKEKNGYIISRNGDIILE